MTAQMTVLVGTVGQGVMRSPDGGESWQRLGIGEGLHSDALVRSLIGHPSQPERVFAGTDRGLYRSDDAGARWQHVVGEDATWSLAVDRRDPKRMFAGTGTPGPAKMFRSEDGGATWDQRPVEVAEECPAVGVPRFTGIAVGDHDTVWASVEVDGVRFSRDGGDTWERLDASTIRNPDGHNVAVVPGSPQTVMVLVQNDVHISRDDGATWQPVNARETFPLGYCRGVAVKPDSQTVFVTIGDSTPGRTGAILRSPDAGRTWQTLSLPQEPNSAMWVASVQAFAPETVFAGSRYGYLYRSDDGGDSWRKLWREVSEVASMTCCPN